MASFGQLKKLAKPAGIILTFGKIWKNPEHDLFADQPP
jgi:hypothetical protein